VRKSLIGQEATFKLLGLLPDTLKLADFFVKVLTEQIIGYYDPKTKVLYVVDGAPDEYVGVTIMHELIHALQDQYINLDSLQRLTGDDDRAAAAQAVIEGQATYEQMYIMSNGNGNIAAQLPGDGKQIRAAIRDGQTQQPVFASAPMVIQKSLLFPYINGSDFVRRYRTMRKEKAPWDEMPQSTEQVMHDRTFFGTAKDTPSVVTMPPGTRAIDDNVMGEFGTRLFFFQHLKNQGQDPAIRAATGWDGDRYVLVGTPAGNALVWVSVWDTPLDAAEFTSALDDVMLARFNTKPVVSGTMRRFTTPKRTIEVSSREINGRSVVFYVDAPAGSGAPIDLAKVQVTPK
jgi:hypothetical protein